MSALDYMLTGNEPLVMTIEDEHGVLAADDFKNTFNNGCLQIAGFEQALVGFLSGSNSMLAPITNMSWMEH